MDRLKDQEPVWAKRCGYAKSTGRVRGREGGRERESWQLKYDLGHGEIPVIWREATGLKLPWEASSLDPYQDAHQQEGEIGSRARSEFHIPVVGCSEVRGLSRAASKVCSSCSCFKCIIWEVVRQSS